MTDSKIRSGVSPKTGELCPNSDSGSRTGSSSYGRSGRRGGRRNSRGLIVALVALALVAAPSVGFAGDKAAETGREGGLGAAAAVSSLVYGPVKLIYATGGLVVGAFAWAFTAGDTQVAEKVFTRSLRGTYVITPGILMGEEELVFIGRDVAESNARPEAVASATAATTETLDDSGYDEMGW